MSRAIHLLPLWAFVACSRLIFTLTFTLPFNIIAVGNYKVETWHCHGGGYEDGSRVGIDIK